MKKILNFIMALLIVWVGSLLYAGHQTEELIRQYVNQINQFYQQSYPGVELELKKFDSNFFDAKAQYAIKINISKLTDGLSPRLDKDDDFVGFLEDAFKTPIVIDQDIQYGPVFFDEGLEFAMAKISFQSTLSNLIETMAKELLPRFESNQQKNKEQLEVFISGLNQALEKEVVINFESVLPFFSNKMHTSGAIGEISVNARDVLLTIGKITFDGVGSMQDLTGHGNFNIPNIIFKHKNVQIFEVQELSISHDINEFIDAFNYFGDVKFDAQKVNIGSSAGEGISLAVALNLKSSRNNKLSDLSDGEINTTVKMLKYPEQVEAMLPFDLPETVSASWSLKGVNSTNFADTMQKFQQYLSTIDADNPKKTPIHVINDIAAGLDKSFVKQVTSFNIDLDITTVKQPKINNTLSLQFIYDFDKGDFLAMINNGDLKKAGEFIKDKIIVNLEAKVSAKILEKFKPMLQAQIQQGIVIEKNGFYQISANYQNKKLMVNGKDMSAIVQQLISPPSPVPTIKAR